jgi:hypothetical protein
LPAQEENVDIASSQCFYTPAIFIVWDDKGPFFALSSPGIECLAAGGAV